MHASCAILVYHLGVDKDERATEKGLQGETARKSASFVHILPFFGIGRGTSLTMFCPIISKFEAILQLVEKKMYPKYGGNMGETRGNGANEG